MLTCNQDCNQGRSCDCRKDRLDNILGVILWALGLCVGVLGYMAATT